MAESAVTFPWYVRQQRGAEWMEGIIGQSRFHIKFQAEKPFWNEPASGLSSLMIEWKMNCIKVMVYERITYTRYLDSFIDHISWLLSIISSTLNLVD